MDRCVGNRERMLSLSVAYVENGQRMLSLRVCARRAIARSVEACMNVDV